MPTLKERVEELEEGQKEIKKKLGIDDQGSDQEETQEVRGLRIIRECMKEICETLEEQLGINLVHTRKKIETL